MTTRLALYNGALLELGERELSALTDNVTARTTLDRVWNDNLVDFVLGQGQWRWARRTSELVPAPAVTPDFGYRLAYEKPSDHVRTCGMYSDEYGQNPLTAYVFEQGYFFTDIEPIYLTYVSNDAQYGGDLSLWDEEFVRYVQVYMASRVCVRLTQDKDRAADLKKEAKKLLLDAKSGDAQEGPTVFPPPGNFVRARLGSRSGRQDRGGRGSLIG